MSSKDSVPSCRGEVHRWRLTVTGLVEQPLSLSVDDLRAMQHHEVNQARAVGHGGPVEAHRWSGVPVLSLLLRALPLPEARFVAAEGDGFVVALPLVAVGEDDPVVADTLNGRALPAARGGPLRLVAANPRVFQSVKRLDRLVVAADTRLDTTTKRRTTGEVL